MKQLKVVVPERQQQCNSHDLYAISHSPDSDFFSSRFVLIFIIAVSYKGWLSVQKLLRCLRFKLDMDLSPIRLEEGSINLLDLV